MTVCHQLHLGHKALDKSVDSRASLLDDFSEHTIVNDRSLRLVAIGVRLDLIAI